MLMFEKKHIVETSHVSLDPYWIPTLDRLKFYTSKYCIADEHIIVWHVLMFEQILSVSFKAFV